MTVDRFDYHNWLAPVVEEDVRYLKEKDRTYGASWKLSGGRSAYFMLLRKMDRIREIMKRPEEPEWFNTTQTSVQAHQHLVEAYRSEDIFAMIEKDPSGQDGCVLAEVRDLRRYLLLVEAEMVSRGVVALTRTSIQVSRSSPQSCEWRPGDTGPQE